VADDVMPTYSFHVVDGQLDDALFDALERHLEQRRMYALVSAAVTDVDL